jgi:hypothetical protein
LRHLLLVIDLVGLPPLIKRMANPCGAHLRVEDGQDVADV